MNINKTFVHYTCSFSIKLSIANIILKQKRVGTTIRDLLLKCFFKSAFRMKKKQQHTLEENQLALELISTAFDLSTLPSSYLIN